MHKMRSVTIENIFDKAQLNSIHHTKLVEKLQDLYDKGPLPDFQKIFLLCLNHAIAVGEKGPAIRIFDFVSKFCAHLETRKSTTERQNNVDKGNDENDDDDDDDDDEDEEPMHPFVSDVFKELLKLHSARTQSARMRVCYCLRKILQSLGPEASIDSDICEEIYTAMLERLKDKSSAVRAQAVTALERLQDPTDSDCPVVKAFLFHLSVDPSSDVRRAVLSCLGRSKQSLPHIRSRIQDVKDTVRKEAYLSLSKTSIRSHSIRNRELILSQGLKDRSDIVRRTVSDSLLPNWFESCQGNFVEFLHALDVENSEISEAALKVLIKLQPKENLINFLEMNSEKLIPSEKLTVELSFFWRCLAEFLQSEEDGQWELVLPELSKYCEYVRRNLIILKDTNMPNKLQAWDHNQNDFIILQLLHITKVFDFGDEAGREKLKQLLIDMLMSSDVRLKLIPVIMDILVKVEPDVDTRLLFVAETISEIHDPLVEEEVQSIPAEEKLEIDFKIAQLRVQKNILEEDLNIAVEEKKYLKAEELKNNLTKITEELASLSVMPTIKEAAAIANRAEDPSILSKCLTIVYEMMQSPSVKSLTPQLRSLMDNFVWNSLQVEHAVVQVIALQCFTVFALLDESLAKAVFVRFCLYLGHTCDEIAQVAAKGIFDLLLMYGLKTFSITEEDGDVENETISPRKKQKKNLMRQSTFIDPTGGSDSDEDNESLKNEDGTEEDEIKDCHLLSLLTKHLDSTQGQMLSCIVEGLCKLLFAMRISAPKLLSRLIILWFNPVHEDDTYLRQMLGQFFKLYATSCPISQETLEQSFIPTINTVINAPASSPLYQVDIEVVAKFLLDLTESGINRYSGEVNIHNNLALQLCNEMLKDNYNSIRYELINILCKMRLALDDDMKSNLQKMVHKIKKDCPDRLSSRAIQKFQSIINAVSETGRKSSEGSEGRNSSQSTEFISVSTYSKRRSTFASEDDGKGNNSKSRRNKALRTESDSMIPSASELTGVIPETSESDSDSVFEQEL